MGTTVTAAFVDADAGAVVVRPGRRLARVSTARRELEQVTTDHSLVAELVRERRPDARGGRAAPSALGDHARASGPSATVDADVFTVPAEPGDLFLLCSDGLTDMLSDGRDRGDDRRRRARPRRRGARRSSPRRTRRAARTTSPSSSSSSSRASPTPEPRAPSRSRHATQPACRPRRPSSRAEDAGRRRPPARRRPGWPARRARVHRARPRRRRARRCTGASRR